jgi:hypothetical protein
MPGPLGGEDQSIMAGVNAVPKAEVWRTIGFWLALIMGLLQAFYAFQAFLDPGAFAVYRGTALAAPADAEWVRIYASRTLFVALVVGLLLVRRDLAALKWIALLGLVMPLSDAILAHQAGATNAIVGRHFATIEPVSKMSTR